MRNSRLPSGLLAVLALISACRNDADQAKVHTGTGAATSGLLAAVNVSIASDGQVTVTCVGEKQEIKTKAEVENNEVCQPAAAPASGDPNPVPADSGNTNNTQGSGLILTFFEKSALKSGAMDCTAREATQPCVEGTEKCTLQPNATLKVSGVSVATERAYDHIQVTTTKSASCQIESGYVYFRHLKFGIKFARAGKVLKSALSAGSTAGSDSCPMAAGTTLQVHNVSLSGNLIAFAPADQSNGCLSGLGAQTLYVAREDIEVDADPLKTFLSGQ